MSKVSFIGEFEIADKELREKFNRLKQFQNQPKKYGKINLPEDFDTMDFNIYRGIDGMIYDDLDLSKYDTTNIIYVNRDTGNDETGTGTSDTPFKTIKAALNYIATLEGETYKIVCQTYRFFRNEFYTETQASSMYTMNKNIIIEPEDSTKRILVSTDQSNLTWTKQSNGVWLTNRSSVYKIYDMSEKDGFGCFKELQKVDYLEDCVNTRNTYYINGSSVYLNTKDGEMPTIDTYLMTLVLYIGGLSLENNNFLRLKNIDFYPAGVIHLQNGSTNFENTLICENVRIFGNNSQNAFDIDNIKKVYMLECVCGKSYMDGFNYHYQGMTSEEIKKCFVYERNCISYENGLKYDETICNCSTTHEGIKSLRVNGIYQNSNGPVIADINDPYSILYNCKIIQEYDRKALSFESTDDALTGKAILVDCESVQYQDLSLNGTTGFNIELKNFYGNYANESLNISEYKEV